MLLHQYENGNCLVKIFQDGTKQRFVKINQQPRPLFPENMDVKITNWCDANCNYCHEASTIKGTHADLRPIIDLLKQLPPGVEIAIGGGHPLAHPDFDYFVQELSKHGLICNVTINEHHFQQELPRLEKLVSDRYITGIGYSYKNTPCDWKYEHLVNHVIIGVTNHDQLERIVKTNKKVLLLGYKQFRKGNNYIVTHKEQVADNINSWYKNLFGVVEHAQISFDNLAIEQLNPKRLFINQNDYNQFYMGDEGSFSMYMDAVKQKVAKASFESKRYPITNNIQSTFDLINIYEK